MTEEPRRIHGSRATRQESGRAMEAYQEYLALPHPRDYKTLVGKKPKSKGGLGKPYGLTTLKEWASVHHWKARAQAHDEEVAKRREESLVRYKLEEQDRRLRQRLASAEVQRAQAMRYLVDQNTMTPRPLQELEPRLAEIAGMYLRQAGDSERIDLADVTKHEPSEKMVINVLTPDGLAQLRDVVGSIRIETPNAHLLEEIIDGEVLDDDDDTAGRPAEPSSTHAGE